MSISSLPLFQAVDEGVTDPLIYRIIERAKQEPASSFAWYQDEAPMAYYFSLRNAAKCVLGKQKVESGQVPDHVEAFLTRMGDLGSRAMTAAQYRECTDAELQAEIAVLQRSLTQKKKAHGGKKRPGVTVDGEGGSDRRIAAEWIEIAFEEMHRRQAIRNFNHLDDVEQRAREKFGDDGLRVIQLYVAQDLAFDKSTGEHDVLINGNPLPQIGEGIEAIAQGDATAAERFVRVLAKARREQNVGLPDGITIGYGPRRVYRSWSEEECREAARVHEGVISFGDSEAGNVFVENVHWHYEDRFPVSAFLHSAFTAERWAAEFAFEQQLKEKDGHPNYYSDMVWARINEPIVCIWYNGHCHIMDGYHRVGSRFFCRIPVVPAIVGVRYEDIKTAPKAKRTRK